jgi:RNA polymerase sigma-70 factor, ECF subfamily
VVLAVTTQASAARQELDELTLRRAQRGEAQACRALVEAYQRPVFAIVSRMLAPAGLRARSEDLAQETFLRVFRALPRFELGGPARLSTWVLTIATRLALDELALKRPDTAVLDVELPGPARTDAQSERRALHAAIACAVAALAPDHRAVFLLREVHELSYEEIARALDVDVGTVKSRLSRARTALQTQLADVKP